MNSEEQAKLICRELENNGINLPWVRATKIITNGLETQRRGFISRNKLLQNVLDEAVSVLGYAVSKYGSTGGPWNVPNDAGVWLERSQRVLEIAKKLS